VKLTKGALYYTLKFYLLTNILRLTRAWAGESDLSMSEGRHRCMRHVSSHTRRRSDTDLTHTRPHLTSHIHSTQSSVITSPHHPRQRLRFTGGHSRTVQQTVQNAAHPHLRQRMLNDKMWNHRLVQSYWFVAKVHCNTANRVTFQKNSGITPRTPTLGAELPNLPVRGGQGGKGIGIKGEERRAQGKVVKTLSSISVWKSFSGLIHWDFKR